MIGINEEVIEGIVFGFIFFAGLWIGIMFMHPAY
jgi:tetrahydromethanopterin S-methyltransferase subunit F